MEMGPATCNTLREILAGIIKIWFVISYLGLAQGSKFTF